MAVIRSDINTLRATDSGSALGHIWIELGERAIPCPQWDDFIVFLLDWWRRGIEVILTRANQTAYFAFMDGMYDFSVDRNEDLFVFRFRYEEEEIYSNSQDVVGTREFVRSYCDLARAVIERIEEDSDWRSIYEGSVPQIDDLRADLPRLEALLKRFGQDQ